MWDMLVAAGGDLRAPRRTDLVYDFLPVAWRTLQHYGVEVNGLRYGMTGHSDVSPWQGLIILSVLSIVLGLALMRLLSTGYKLRA